MNIFAVLRFLHIVAGIIWAGGGLLMYFVFAPAIAATGDAGKQYAGYLITKTPFTKIMLVAGVTTVAAGSWLYGIDSSWFQSNWMMTGQGTVFGMGGMLGIAALVFGFMVGNVNSRLAMLGGQIQGKPTAEQAAELGALAKRQAWVSKANAWCIIVAVVMMASARFFA